MSGQDGKKFKIIGITLFSIGFLINPLICLRLSHHFLLFSTVFFIIGLIFYIRIFERFGLGKKIIEGIKHLQKNNNWWLLIVQSIIFIFYIGKDKDFLFYQARAGAADEPSYTQFDFSSWETILGGHRTVGLPLIIKIYFLVFKDLNFWPHFQMISYVLSIFFLYGCLLKFGFNKMLSLLVVSILLWDESNYRQFMSVATECFAATFLHFTVGSLLLAVKRWSWKTAILLGVTVFSLYLVRPNFSFIPVLIPLWASGISIMREGFNRLRIQKVILRFSLCAILPLVLFCLLRLLVVGEFGVVSMSGGSLAGHAVHFLNENNIQSLTGDVRKLADEILIRKRQLTPPANLSPFEWMKKVPEQEKIQMEASAFGGDLMTAWTVAIKQLEGVEPFTDPKFNIEPWYHTHTLAPFYSRYYSYKTDRLLMRFSKEILPKEWRRYVHWLVGGTFYGLSEYWQGWSWLIWLGFLGIAKLFYLEFARGLDGIQLKRWHKEIGILMMIAASIFVIGFIPIVAFSFPQPRLMSLIGIYILPGITCLALPPFWLKEEATHECNAPIKQEESKMELAIDG